MSRYDNLYKYSEYIRNLSVDDNCQWIGGTENEDGSISMSHPSYDSQFLDFINELYNTDLLDNDYLKTLENSERKIMGGLGKEINEADIDVLRAILTYYVRQERFCEGLWETAVAEKIFPKLLNRLQELEIEHSADMEKSHRYAIYTMRNYADLMKAFNEGRMGMFSEKKAWTTGLLEFKKAWKNWKPMYIFFSAAEDAKGIIFVAKIRNIQIDVDTHSTRYQFYDLESLNSPKPLSFLILKSTNKPLSDYYIRPYAIVLKPLDLDIWLSETGFPAIGTERKSGEEFFHSGKLKHDIQLKKFWQWAYSDLINNTTRGALAEFIVAEGLEISKGTRPGWGAYDLTYNDIKIEVKSSAYIQGWHQKEYSKIIFGINKTLGWSETDGAFDVEQKRQADIYIFCLFKHIVNDSVDPLDINQWEFYILKTDILNSKCNNSKSISLKKLLSLEPRKSTYEKLKENIDKYVLKE